jgi:AraC-like DNA-binding protein
MTNHYLERPDLSVHFPRVIIARAVQRGIPLGTLLEAVRLSAQLLADDRTRITPTQLGAVIRVAWRELDDELLGFGAAPHRFGMFALMARQMVGSANLGDALRYSIRFYNLTSQSLRWSLAEGSGASLSLTLTEPARDPDHFIEEFMLLIWHRFCNWLIGERIPLQRTGFSFGQTSHSEEYRIMFPGPVSYGRGPSEIVFNSDWLRAPVVRSRSELRDYLMRLPDEWFIKQEFEYSISDRVLKVLGEASTFPGLPELASNWHMSGRTLHRQLKREGSSYRALLEQVRRARAIGLLLEGKLPVGEIARRLDMSEPAFSRAFKHWTGMAPLAYRKARS